MPSGIVLVAVMVMVMVMVATTCQKECSFVCLERREEKELLVGVLEFKKVAGGFFEIEEILRPARRVFLLR